MSDGTCSDSGCYGCYGCGGCRGCDGCYGCGGCYGCDGCYGCYGCYGCDGCYYSFALSDCKATYKSLFSKGLFGDKFKLFNQPATEKRIDEIRSKLNSFGWYPKQTNAFDLYVQNGNQWSKIDSSKLTTKSWEVSWKDCPKEMLAYIHSLLEFDSALFKEITGIDLPKVKPTAEGQDYCTEAPTYTDKNGKRVDDAKKEPSIAGSSHTVSNASPLSEVCLDDCIRLSRQMIDEGGQPVNFYRPQFRYEFTPDKTWIKYYWDSPEKPSTSLPPSRMSIVDSYRNSSFSAEERTLRKAGVKDSCGNLTQSGKDFVLAFLADQHKADLVKHAKKFLKAQKGEEDDE